MQNLTEKINIDLQSRYQYNYCPCYNNKMCVNINQCKSVMLCYLTKRTDFSLN